MTHAAVSLVKAEAAATSRAPSMSDFVRIISNIVIPVCYAMALMVVLPLLPVILMMHLIAFLESGNS